MPPSPPHDSADQEDTFIVDPPAEASTRRPATKVGRFAIIEKIGAGGMGDVYAAYDENLERRVAVKVLSQRVGLDKQSRVRLVREAHALARVSHPNVVEIFDVGEQDGEVFIAMEFIRGPTLRQWQEDASRGWAEVLQVYVGAGEGLAAMHDHGLVHRDFKPGNVLVDSRGRGRLIDFGLVRKDEPQADGSLRPASPDRPSPLQPSGARTDDAMTEPGSEPEASDGAALTEGAGDSLTKTGALMGTMMYMSPEQFWGNTATAASDQFSFCVALFEALYGRQPFNGLTRRTRALAVTGGQLIARPRDVPVPPKLYEILARGMSRAAEDRFAGMAELLEALRRLLAKYDPELEDPRLLRSRRRIFAGFFGFALAVYGTLGTLVYTGRAALSPDIVAAADGVFLLVFGTAVAMKRKRWTRFRHSRMMVGFALFVLSVYLSQDLLSHAIGRSAYQSLVGNVAFLVLTCLFMAPVLVGSLRWLSGWSLVCLVAMLFDPSRVLAYFIACNLGAAVLGLLVIPRQVIMPWTAPAAVTGTGRTGSRSQAGPDEGGRSKG